LGEKEENNKENQIQIWNKLIIHGEKQVTA
jgi:hypothetical protein